MLLGDHIPSASADPEQVAVKLCPAPTPVYTGYETRLSQIESCIADSNGERRVCVVRGLGGSGKTQLALKAIERTREKWNIVIYVDAGSREMIKNTLKGLAIDTKIGNTHEDTIRWLESYYEPWLLVFDNVDDPLLNIVDFFPAGSHGSILITTRLDGMTQLARGPGSDCNVTNMDAAEALMLLLKVARVEDQILSDQELKAAAALVEVHYTVATSLAITNPVRID